MVGHFGAERGRQARTRVYLTVDVECAEERVGGGRVQPALGYDVRVWGRLANQREELGLRLILAELEAAGLAGTFFVEPLASASFGRAGLGEVCREILDRGHDVQLHLHPVQRRARWHSEGATRADDDLAAYPRADQAALLREGVELLAAAGVPRERLLAFRAGNFGASNETWGAMREAGLRLSSSYNPCYFGRCRMRTSRAEPGLFASDEPGVWELPITCFVQPTGRFRHLQIAATSLDETIHCLLASRALGVAEVTIVTHSFELFFLDAPERRRGRPNALHQRRLRGLCRFLAERRDLFEVETVGALAARLPASAAATSTRPAKQLPQGLPSLYLARLAEQAQKRLVARLG